MVTMGLRLHWTCVLLPLGCRGHQKEHPFLESLLIPVCFGSRATRETQGVRSVAAAARFANGERGGALVGMETRWYRFRSRAVHPCAQTFPKTELVRFMEAFKSDPSPKKMTLVKHS